MASQQKYYNHSDYVKCFDVANFAKLYNFKNKSGKVLGRNKVYAVLKALGIINKDNEPYQQYIDAGYLKCQFKQYYMGDKVIPKNITLITQKGMKYLADKINEYLGTYG